MSEALAEALREAERFMSYFSGETGGSFAGDGTPATCLFKIRAALAAYDAKREAALQELADLGQAWDAAPGPDLSDPNVVHLNMLRGTIAKPTVDQIIHIYGIDALCKELAPQIVREAEEASAPGPAVSDLPDGIWVDLDTWWSVPRENTEKYVRSALTPAASPAPWTPPAWTDVLAERRRQIEVEGWHPARDDAYTSGELALAGSAYAAASTYYHADPFAAVLSIWPWDSKWLKPTTPRRDLVKAAALILAEIERIDRIPPAPAGEGKG